MCVLLTVCCHEARPNSTVETGAGHTCIAVDMAEPQILLPLAWGAATPTLSILEQGGHCEFGDGRGQGTDWQSLRGHVGGESDTTGARLAPRKTECSGGQGADARVSCAVSQPGESGAWGEGEEEAWEQPGRGQRSAPGFVEKPTDVWRPVNSANWLENAAIWKRRRLSKAVLFPGEWEE